MNTPLSAARIQSLRRLDTAVNFNAIGIVSYIRAHFDVWSIKRRCSSITKVIYTEPG
jgi:hypothetical protein